MGLGEKGFLGGESMRDRKRERAIVHLAWGPHGQAAHHRQGHRMPSPPLITSLLLFPALHVVLPFSQIPTWHQSFPTTVAPTLLLFQTRMWSFPSPLFSLFSLFSLTLTSPHLVSVSPANYHLLFLHNIISLYLIYIYIYITTNG